MIRIVDDNLQNAAWVTGTGLDVNPIPADGFVPSHTPTGALKVTNASSKDMGGALVSCKRPFPIYGGFALPFIQVRKSMYVSKDELFNLGRKEFDLKVVVKSGSAAPIANTANFSTQLNLSTGQWQLDPAGKGWVDTGFQPQILPDQWTNVAYNFALDVSKGTWGVLSVLWGSQGFTVPAQFQNLPLLTSNWGVVAALQIQTEVMKAGGLTTLYDQISIAYSDQPFV